ncbi:MAG: hypothetical protein M1352_02670 [Patescibacteria group bacterium]|nr:hypothetical protein [Patescibacteria group bacterium]
MKREQSFYAVLAVVALAGIVLTTFLVYKASKLPAIYNPSGSERLSTSSSIIKEASPSSPSFVIK